METEKKIFINKKTCPGMWNINNHKTNNGLSKIAKEVKINHHPRLFSVYFSKKKWKNNMNFQPSHFHLKIKKNPHFLQQILDLEIKLLLMLIKFKKY